MELGGERDLAGCTLRWDRLADDGLLVIGIGGEMDLGNAGELRATVLDLAARPGVRGLCLDLGGVTFIDSSGLSSLIVVKVEADAAGLAMEITNPSHRTRRVLEMAGVADYLNVAAAERRPDEPGAEKPL